MALRNAELLPCWQVNDDNLGHPPGADLDQPWAHYKTEDRALTDADEQIRDWLADNADLRVADVPKLVAVRSYDRPCAEVVCDSCGLVWEDAEYGGTHLDPLDPTPLWMLSCSEWVAAADGKHYCPGCVGGRRLGDDLAPSNTWPLIPVAQAQETMPWGELR